VRAWHGRIGEGGVAGADLEILSGGDGGKQHEYRDESGGEFRNGESGHWEPQKSCGSGVVARRKAVLVEEFSEAEEWVSRQ